VLAAAAAATERIGLFTGVLLATTRDPVILAKQAATLDQLSGGRFVLGVGVGRREDDFTSTGTSYRDRGRRHDQALELMHRAWRGEPVAGSPKAVTPAPVNGESVPMIFGGTADPVLRRAARWGVGWSAGGGGAEMAAGMFTKVREAWKAAGRGADPELRALHYFGLGDEAEPGRDYLCDYYGERMGAMIWPGVARDEAAVRIVIGQFEEAGATELSLSPTVATLSQLERLARAVFG
jgi:alkanesulfonate monooxygenase SsuD/methylene tetrahydromethanopterin reductase-like flavin-dependent oxidoreductase (luciferase family)